MKLFMKEHSYFIDLRPVSKLQVPVVCDRNQVLVSSEPETKVQFIFQASNFSNFFHFLALSILVRILTPWTCGACTFSRHSGSWRFFVQRYFSVLDIPAQACYGTGISWHRDISSFFFSQEYSFINQSTPLLSNTYPLGSKGKKFVCPSYHLSK